MMKKQLGLAVCAASLLLVWCIFFRNTNKDTDSHPTTGIFSRRGPRVAMNRAVYHQFRSDLVEENSKPSIPRINENVSRSVAPVHPNNLSIDKLENITRPTQPQKLYGNRSQTPTVRHDHGTSRLNRTTPDIQKTSSTHLKCRSNEQAKIKSVWFSSKVKSDVPVFLNRVNSSVTGIARKWWFINMHMRDVGLEGVISSLLQVVPGKHTFHVNGSECLSCAIVGNAGNLHGSGYGKLIDSKDIVIRSNTSPIKGFEQDVGTRTTHQILYPESGRDYHPGAAILFLPFKTQDLRWLRSIFTTKDVTRGFWKGVPTSVNGAKPEETYIIHPAFLHYVHSWFSSLSAKWPSAGDVSLILGLHMCDELHVMGFGLNKYGRWDHYYEAKVGQDAGLRPNQVYHPVDQEAIVRKQLQTNGIITVYPGRT